MEYVPPGKPAIRNALGFGLHRETLAALGVLKDQGDVGKGLPLTSANSLQYAHDPCAYAEWLLTQRYAVKNAFSVHNIYCLLARISAGLAERFFYYLSTGAR